MNNFGKLAAFAVALYVLQTSFFPLIAYHGISPNFMLLLTCLLYTSDAADE